MKNLDPFNQKNILILTYIKSNVHFLIRRGPSNHLVLYLIQVAKDLFGSMLMHMYLRIQMWCFVHSSCVYIVLVIIIQL